MSIEDTITERLLRLDACAVSDALDKLGLRGSVTKLAQLSSRRRIAGRVHTVKLAVKGTPSAADARAPRHLGSLAIEAARAGEIIVVEQKTGLDAGSWGGILSLGAKIRGIAGVIADGPVRDIDEARDMDFPIYGLKPTVRTARNRVIEAATDVPILVDDVAVNPGDYVIADSSGIVFLAAGDAERIVAEAERIAAREAAMAKSLLAGEPIGVVMGADYEHMLR